MIRRGVRSGSVAMALVLALGGCWGAARASGSAPAAASLEPPARADRAAAPPPALEALVPEIAANPWRLEPGVRPFAQRLSFSPGYGTFGTDRMFALRAAFNPSSWLGYEASIGHDAGHAVHAVLHTFSAIVRRPRAGRLQPFVSGGYGMMNVFPGRSVNAAPVTKNALTIGGGLELYIRSDLALRADLLHATVFGKQKDRDGIVAYDYLQGTVGLAFYRSVRP